MSHSSKAALLIWREPSICGEDGSSSQAKLVSRFPAPGVESFLSAKETALPRISKAKL